MSRTTTRGQPTGSGLLLLPGGGARGNRGGTAAATVERDAVREQRLPDPCAGAGPGRFHRSSPGTRALAPLRGCQRDARSGRLPLVGARTAPTRGCVRSARLPGSAACLVGGVVGGGGHAGLAGHPPGGSGRGGTAERMDHALRSQRCSFLWSPRFPDTHSPRRASAASWCSTTRYTLPATEPGSEGLCSCSWWVFRPPAKLTYPPSSPAACPRARRRWRASHE